MLTTTTLGDQDAFYITMTMRQLGIAIKNRAINPEQTQARSTWSLPLGESDLQRGHYVILNTTLQNSRLRYLHRYGFDRLCVLQINKAVMDRGKNWIGEFDPLELMVKQLCEASPKLAIQAHNPDLELLIDGNLPLAYIDGVITTPGLQAECQKILDSVLDRRSPSGSPNIIIRDDFNHPYTPDIVAPLRTMPMPVSGDQIPGRETPVTQATRYTVLYPKQLRLLTTPAELLKDRATYPTMEEAYRKECYKSNTIEIKKRNTTVVALVIPNSPYHAPRILRVISASEDGAKQTGNILSKKHSWNKIQLLLQIDHTLHERAFPPTPSATATSPSASHVSVSSPPSSHTSSTNASRSSPPSSKDSTPVTSPILKAFARAKKSSGQPPRRIALSPVKSVTTTKKRKKPPLPKDQLTILGMFAKQDDPRRQNSGSNAENHENTRRI